MSSYKAMIVHPVTEPTPIDEDGRHVGDRISEVHIPGGEAPKLSASYGRLTGLDQDEPEAASHTVFLLYGVPGLPGFLALDPADAVAYATDILICARAAMERERKEWDVAIAHALSGGEES